MPADYGAIRAENIARYGWDTAVLDLLGHLYSDRTHFIFELIQNAEDAGASELTFTLFADRLEVWHDGRPFTEADVRGLSGVAQSTKSGDLTSIGRFGIGFKSVYAYTKNPQIYSAGQDSAGSSAANASGSSRSCARSPSTRPGAGRRSARGAGRHPVHLSVRPGNRARPGRGDRDRRRAERTRAGHAAVPAAPQPAAGQRSRRSPRCCCGARCRPGLRAVSGSVFRNPPFN